MIGENFQSWGEIDNARDDIVNIGKNVVLGRDSLIITHCPISFYDHNPVGIEIGDNVYIGARCIILPGARIGESTVIGAGSVVACPIPDGVTAAGNPCRVIRPLTRVEKIRLKLMAEQHHVGNGTEPDWGELRGELKNP